MKKKKADHQTDWHPCEAGEVGRVVTRLQNRRLLGNLRRDLGVAAVLFTFVLSGYVVADTWPNRPVDLGGILCFEMSKLTDAIVSGHLPPETEICVRRHLSMCAHCRERVERTRLRLQEQEDGEFKEADERQLPPEAQLAGRYADPHAPLLSAIDY